MQESKTIAANKSTHRGDNASERVPRSGALGRKSLRFAGNESLARAAPCR